MPQLSAGDKFAVDMAHDAFVAHDRDCCTEQNPCALRQRIHQYVQKVSRQPSNTVEPVTGSTGRPTGSDSAGRIGDPGVMTAPQAGYIKRLAPSADKDLLSPRHRDLLRQVLAGQSIPRRSASDLIDALVAQGCTPTTASGSSTSRATDKTVRLLRSLMERKGRTEEIDYDDLTQPQASAMIQALNALPDAKQLDDGVYLHPSGDIYKVQRNVAMGDGTRAYAKKLVKLREPEILRDGKVRTHKFVVDPGGIRKLTPAMLMTLEQAQEFGALYGTCVRCGLTLTNEDSVTRRLGSTCYKKMKAQSAW